MSKKVEVSSLLSVGELCAKLGEPLHRIVYVLRTRPRIKPVVTHGRLRFYSESTADEIRDALAAMDARRLDHGGAR